MSATTRHIAAGLIGLGAVAAAGVWALAPLQAPDLSIPPTALVPEVTAADAEPMVAALDLSAFRAPLWIAPPPPPAPVVAAKEPEPPPPPPLRLQLLAIVREEDGTYRALVYDPDTDALLTLAEGQSVGTRTVEGVAAREVRLREAPRGGGPGGAGGALRTLALRDDGPASAGGVR